MSSLQESYIKLLEKIQSPIKSQESFQNVQNGFIKLNEMINSLTLFSNNESISEIPTSSLRYIIINFKQAEFVDQHGMIMLNTPEITLKRNRFRRIILNIVENLLLKFFNLTSSLGLLLDKNNNLLPMFKFTNKWIETFIKFKSHDEGSIDLNKFEAELYNNSGPMGRRESKITKWQLEKVLTEESKDLDELQTLNDDIENEDIVRSQWNKKIQLYIIKAISMADAIIMEREMLDNIIKNSSQIEELSSGKEREEEDSRLKDSLKFDKTYTDKVETLATDKKSLLSKEGKVLRPFTIVGSQNDKRSLLKSKVFGTGQELPTMTVEELVDYEMANGGMVKPQEPEPEIDEDDINYQDKETYRLREWDEFTDTHKKGSGNKMGNLG